MRKDKILIRNRYMPVYTTYDETTDITFIPVCDNCNYVFDRVVAQVGVPYLEPYVCPNCGKIINCIRLPQLDANGKLNYEEN